MILSDYVTGWIDELSVQRRYSACTLKAYSTDLHEFLSFIEEHFGRQNSVDNLKELQVADFRAWLSHRISTGLSARSNARALSSVKSFFNYLAKYNLVDLEVINSVRRPKLSKLLPKPIQQNVIFELLNAECFFENDPQWITERDKAIYSLLYCTGLRISEALNIKTKDVNSEMQIRGKGKKDRVVIVLPNIIQQIEKYISVCPYDLSDGFLFVGLKGKKLHASAVDNRLEKLRLQYKLPTHSGAHAFRHSFATHLIQNGADLRSVQDLLGHESLSSTQIYTDVDDYNLLKIYEHSHPLEKKV